MKYLHKLALILLAIVTVSCSSEPQLISAEDIDKVIEGKEEVSRLVFSASGDLTYDYPSYMRVEYVENGKRYSQILDVQNGINEPKEESPLNTRLYYTVKPDELYNFDTGKVIENAIAFITKESEDGFENFAVSEITFTPTKNFKNEKEIKRVITLQATQKGEKAKHELGRRRVTTVRNFYEFKFDILENSEVKIKE